MKKEKSQAINESDINKLFNITINMIMDEEYFLKPDEIDKLCEMIPQAQERNIPNWELIGLFGQKILHETNIRIESYIAISNYFESRTKPDGKGNVKPFICFINNVISVIKYILLLEIDNMNTYIKNIFYSHKSIATIIYIYIIEKKSSSISLAMN